MICKNDGCHCKFDGNLGECPQCGEPVDIPRDNMVQQWNSTLKADPSKRPKSTKKPRPRRKGWRNLAKTMREFVREKYPGYSGQAVQCTNCGKRIKTIKFENVSHIEGRGAQPGKAHDFNNMEILCGPTDYFGEVDNSCHTLWERNDIAAFNKKGEKHGK